MMEPETISSSNEMNVFSSMSKSLLQEEKLSFKQKLAKRFSFKTPKALKDFYHLFFPVTIVLGTLICIIFIVL
jgi:hypothetical protein